MAEEERKQSNTEVRSLKLHVANSLSPSVIRYLLPEQDVATVRTC